MVDFTHENVKTLISLFHILKSQNIPESPAYGVFVSHLFEISICYVQSIFLVLNIHVCFIC